MSKKENYYIDNDVFFDEMVEWKNKVIEAESSGEPKPQVTEYIGECFMKISEKLSHRPNFVNYPYREEMVSDGIENCLMYAHNFDPEKSKNPFAYFTQVIHYAFLRRIQKEKKQLDIKTKIIEKTGFDEVMAVDDNSLAGNSSDYNTIKENVQIKIK